MNSNAENQNSLPPEVRETFAKEGMQRQMERVWDLAGASTPEQQNDSDEERDAVWSALKAQISASTLPTNSSTGNFTSEARTDRPALRLVKTQRWLAIAASFAILLASGYGFWQIPVTVTAPYGQTVVASLPDGSSVELNSGASIQYTRGFKSLPVFGSTERFVRLDGEAFFNVEKSESQFTVHTFNTQVAVLGTRFNIRSWDNAQNQTSVTLESGIVEVASLQELDRKVLLDEPGEQVILKGNENTPVAPEMVDLENVLIWRDSGLSINREVLESVFEELERRFDVVIDNQNVQAASKSITLMFPNPGSLESILDDICTSNELQYRKTSRGYEIY